MIITHLTIDASVYCREEDMFEYCNQPKAVKFADRTKSHRKRTNLWISSCLKGGYNKKTPIAKLAQKATGVSGEIKKSSSDGVSPHVLFGLQKAGLKIASIH